MYVTISSNSPSLTEHLNLINLGSFVVLSSSSSRLSMTLTSNLVPSSKGSLKKALPTSSFGRMVGHLSQLNFDFKIFLLSNGFNILFLISGFPASLILDLNIFCFHMRRPCTFEHTRLSLLPPQSKLLFL